MWISIVVIAFVAIIMQLLIIPHLMPDFSLTSIGSEITSPKGKTVLITGASFGIGRSLVEEYAREGASVIIMAARSVEKMEKTRNEIYDLGIATRDKTVIHILKADLSTKEASEKCIEDSLKLLDNSSNNGNGNKGQGLDYLILNHITNSRFGTWLKDNKELPGGHDFLPGMFATNTFSYIWMATHAIDALDRNKGHIIVVSSLAGWIGPPKCAVYSATKHALHGFFDSLRLELNMTGKDHITITTASLGPHDTEGAAEVKHHVNSKFVKWAPAVTAARAIISGASLKKREIFHPHMMIYPLVMIRPFFPSLCDWLLAFSYN
jgi:short-subunit dehydrogenase